MGDATGRSPCVPSKSSENEIKRCKRGSWKWVCPAVRFCHSPHTAFRFSCTDPLMSILATARGFFLISANKTMLEGNSKPSLLQRSSTVTPAMVEPPVSSDDLSLKPRCPGLSGDNHERFTSLFGRSKTAISSSTDEKRSDKITSVQAFR